MQFRVISRTPPPTHTVIVHLYLYLCNSFLRVLYTVIWCQVFLFWIGIIFNLTHSTAVPDQSGHWSNGTKEVLHIRQSSRTGVSPSDAFLLRAQLLCVCGGGIKLAYSKPWDDLNIICISKIEIRNLHNNYLHKKSFINWDETYLRSFLFWDKFVNSFFWCQFNLLSVRYSCMFKWLTHVFPSIVFRISLSRIYLC